MYLTLIKTFLTAKAAWIKYAVMAILTVMVLAYVYSAGKHSERAEWLSKEAKFLTQQNEIKEAAEKRVEEQQAKYNEILMGVINEHNKEKTELDNRIAVLSNQRMFINTKKCTGSGGVSAKTESSGQPDSSSDRTELSAEDAENIRNDYATAQQLVNQYNDLRALCLPLVEVVQ